MVGWRACVDALHVSLRVCDLCQWKEIVCVPGGSAVGLRERVRGVRLRLWVRGLRIAVVFDEAVVGYCGCARRGCGGNSTMVALTPTRRSDRILLIVSDCSSLSLRYGQRLGVRRNAADVVDGEAHRCPRYVPGV